MRKIPIAVLGCTGLVGQQFIRMLIHHPYFEITALTASAKSEGKNYCDITFSCLFYLGHLMPG